jgi:hypothetical protein
VSFRKWKPSSKNHIWVLQKIKTHPKHRNWFDREICITKAIGWVHIFGESWFVGASTWVFILEWTLRNRWPCKTYPGLRILLEIISSCNTTDHGSFPGTLFWNFHLGQVIPQINYSLGLTQEELLRAMPLGTPKPNPKVYRSTHKNIPTTHKTIPTKHKTIPIGHPNVYRWTIFALV